MPYLIHDCLICKNLPLDLGLDYTAVRVHAGTRGKSQQMVITPDGRSHETNAVWHVHAVTFGRWLLARMHLVDGGDLRKIHKKVCVDSDLCTPPFSLRIALKMLDIRPMMTSDPKGSF